MKINISAELNMQELAEYFAAKLKENGIESTLGTIKALAFSDKKNEYVDVKEVKLVFTKE